MHGTDEVKERASAFSVHPLRARLLSSAQGIFHPELNPEAQLFKGLKKD